MPAALDDAPLVEHHDLIGVAHGAHARGHHDHRASGEHLVRELALDGGLGLGVHRRERVVEDQDGGVEQQRARQGGALALAAREHHAPLSHQGLVAVRQVRDVLRELGPLRRATRSDRGIVAFGNPERDVLGSSVIGEQEGVLGNHGDVRFAGSPSRA